MRKINGLKILVIGSLWSLSGCAILHKVQLSDIDNRSEFALVPFELKVSETGVDLQEANRIQRGLFRNSQESQAIGDIAAVIALFQQGPRTGAPVYTEGYAQKLVFALHQQCPSGKITGVMSIRETRKYPVISGEIVKLTGFCMRERKPASTQENVSEGNEG